MVFHVRYLSVILGLLLSVFMARLAGFDLSILDKLLPSINENLEEAPLRKVKIAPKKTHKNKSESDEAPYTFFEVLTDDKNAQFIDMKVAAPSFTNKAKTPPAIKENPPKQITKSIKGEQINVAAKTVEKTSKKILTTKTLLENNFSKSSGKYVVQAGSFRKIASANRLVAKLKSRGYAAYWKEKEVEGKKWFRVYLGSFSDHDRALAMVQKARVQEKLDPMIIFQKN